MSNICRRIAGALAGGVVVLSLCVPAGAVDLGVGASIGGRNGINAGLGASIGGGDGVTARAGASIGGGDGVNAGLGANIGGNGGVAARASATVGGSDGLDAALGATVGGADGIGAGVGIGVGDGVDVGAGVGTGGGIGTDRRRRAMNPATPNAPGIANPPAATSVVANISDSERERFRRRCTGILSDAAGYDADLVAMCQMLQSQRR